VADVGVIEIPVVRERFAGAQIAFGRPRRHERCHSPQVQLRAEVASER
jgi:hypothetical protein